MAAFRTSALRRAAFSTVWATTAALMAWPALAENTPQAPTAILAESVDPGAYLAARTAEMHGDFRAAAAWFARAHLADPSNQNILDGAVFAELNLGNVRTASDMARKVLTLAESGHEVNAQLVDFALLSDAALQEDYAGIVAALEAGRSVAPLVDNLALAWSRMGAGNMSAALDEFDKVSKAKGFEAFGLYHKALALALAGDFEGADDILSGRASGQLNLNRRGLIAHVQVLSQLERNPDALKLLERSVGRGLDPVVDDLYNRLTAGQQVGFDTVRSARDGIAEVFFSVATLLIGEADPSYTLMNSRIAATLRPDHAEAQLMTASVLEELGQYSLAVETYALFPADHPAYSAAEQGRAEALYADGQIDEAIGALKALAAAYPGDVAIQSSYGDLLRREERWPEALEAYNAAIALTEKLGGPSRNEWVLFFSRAITQERQKSYDLADHDFRQALKLRPGQPQVLNYLGYSMIERGKNLDEALSLIEEAVAAQPDAGYIIDSLAWAYFQLGRYQDALEPMEKASILEPVDPVVTDHLGDVYWMNGRKREAEFQWHRALSFAPLDEDAIRIRRKLEVGLDLVMEEEAKNGKATGN